jgi:hypothetical protein
MEKIKFTCYGSSRMKPWDGTILPLKLTAPYEVEVTARGSTFHLIVGHHRYGDYICIPNWNVGTQLASLTDRFWNYERLTGYTELKSVDAYSVTSALVALSKIVN